MAAIFNWSWPGRGRSAHFRDIHKLYTVSGGTYAAKADTLAEAKAAGAAIAKREAWRGHFNAMWTVMTVDKQSAPGSVFYKNTGWKMYIPVRGSGHSAEHILTELKRRHGVKPLVWVRGK